MNNEILIEKKNIGKILNYYNTNEQQNYPIIQLNQNLLPTSPTDRKILSKDFQYSTTNYNLKINEEKNMRDSLIFVNNSSSLAEALFKKTPPKNFINTTIRNYKSQNNFITKSYTNSEFKQMNFHVDKSENLNENKNQINFSNSISNIEIEFKKKNSFENIYNYNKNSENVEMDYKINSENKGNENEIVYKNNVLSNKLKNNTDSKSTEYLEKEDNSISESLILNEIEKIKSQKSEELLQIMLELFQNNAENQKNSDKQTAFEIAQSNEDLEAVCLMYDFLLERRNKKILKNIEKAKVVLSQNPNFYMEMKWEVTVPLFSYFCPSDICKIWKYDQNVRMNYSFIEFKNLSSIRCPSSWFFVGGFNTANQPKDFENKNYDNNLIKNFTPPVEENKNANIYRANLKINNYFNPFEVFDESEKQLIIKDIMNSHRIHGEFKLKNCVITESLSSWTKKPIFEKINGWNCKKYEVSITAFINLHNKEKFYYENLNKENYFDEEKPLHKKILYCENKEDTKKNIANGLKVKNDKMRNALMKMSDNKDKKLKAYVWIAENFPIKSSVQ